MWVAPAVAEPLSVSSIVGACAVDDREAERAGGEGAAVGVDDDRADDCAGDRLAGDAGDGGVGAEASDGAGAGSLGERDDGAVVAGDGVAGRVLTVAVSTRVAPEVRFAVEPESEIWLAAPWTTVKAPRVPVVSPPRWLPS